MNHAVFGALFLWCEKCYSRIDLDNFMVIEGAILCPLCGSLR